MQYSMVGLEEKENLFRQRGKLFEEAIAPQLDAWVKKACMVMDLTEIEDLLKHIALKTSQGGILSIGKALEEKTGTNPCVFAIETPFKKLSTFLTDLLNKVKAQLN